MIYAKNKLKKEYLHYRLNYLKSCLKAIPTASWERTKAENIQVLCDQARIEEIERLLKLPEITEFEVIERYKELEREPQYDDYAMSSRLIELIDLLPSKHWFRLNKEKETDSSPTNSVSSKESAI